MATDESVVPPISPSELLPGPASVSPVAPVASVVHTIILIGLLVAVSAMTARSQHVFAERNGRVSIYLVTMTWEWLLFGFVLFGLKRRGVHLREIIGGRYKSPEDLLLDVAIAAGYWLVAALALAGLGFALGLAGAENIEATRKTLGFLVPRSSLEVGLWFLLSVTAGFCEEIIFRGYLQRQFAAITRKTYLGIPLSGIVFGVSHGYEGGPRMLLIAVYGIMFGLLAQWRKSLRPGMMAHAWHDAFSGMVLRMLK
jgi:uncharacterized protein